MDQEVPFGDYDINSSTEDDLYEYSSIDEKPELFDSDMLKISKSIYQQYQNIIQKSMNHRLYSTNQPKEFISPKLPFKDDDQRVPVADSTMYGQYTDRTNPPTNYAVKSQGGAAVHFDTNQNSIQFGDHTVEKFHNHIKNSANNLSLLKALDVLEQNQKCQEPLHCDADIETQIQKAIVCQFDVCHDDECLMGKRRLKDLVEEIRDRHMSPRGTQTLTFLWRHCQNCEEIVCKAQCCMTFSNRKKSTKEDLIDCIDSLHKEFIEYDKCAEFLKFSTNCKFDSAKDVFNNQMDIVPALSYCETRIIYLDKKYELVTKIPGTFKTEYLGVLKEVGTLRNHAHILPIDWIIINPNEIYFSCKFYVEPLQKKLLTLELNLQKVKKIILDLIRATKYLNGRGMLFLAWTTGNILLNTEVPLLTNFHMGATKISEVNKGISKCLVFPTILPPEFHIIDGPVHKADVWGVCCLLKELCTSKVVHEDLIHLERSEVWREMCRRKWTPQFMPDSSLMEIFLNGWECQPNERASLDELERLFI